MKKEHTTAGLRDQVTQLRSDLRRSEDRATAAEKERDKLRQQVRTLTYGGPVNSRIQDWDDHLETVNRVDVAALSVAISQARNGHLRAQHYDPESRVPLIVCAEHDRDVSDCHRAELLCRGVHIDAPTDPTGKAGADNADNGDKAEQDLRVLDQCKAKLAWLHRALIRLHEEYKPRPADAYQRLNVDNTPGCKSCARLAISLSDGTKVPWWNEIYRTGLCWKCKDHDTKTGQLPPLRILQAWHDGKSVKVSA